MKKSNFFSGRATKGGGGGVKAWPLKKIIFGKFVVFDKFVAILRKKYGPFSPKILWRIFFVRIRFRLF